MITTQILKNNKCKNEKMSKRKSIEIKKEEQQSKWKIVWINLGQFNPKLVVKAIIVAK